MNMMKKETLRLSNSLNLSDRLYDICKSGWMTKRSQNKKLLTPTNYKTRWFELTKYFLYYFDVENVEVSFFIFDFHFFVFFLHFLCLSFCAYNSVFVIAYLLFECVWNPNTNEWKRKAKSATRQAGRMPIN